MKKLWNRIRKGLIRKLGGTDKIPRPPMLRQAERPIVTISASYVASRDEANCIGFDALDWIVRNKMAEKIVQDLMTGSIMSVSRTYDTRKGEITFMGRVSVVLNIEERGENA